MQDSKLFVGELRTVQFFRRDLSSVFTARDKQFDFVVATVALAIENLVAENIIVLDVDELERKIFGFFKTRDTRFALRVSSDRLSENHRLGFIERQVIEAIKSRPERSVDDYVKTIFKNLLVEKFNRPARQVIDLITLANTMGWWDARNRRDFFAVGEFVLQISPELENELMGHLNDIVLKVVKARNSQSSIKKFSEHVYACCWSELELKEIDNG